jgi:hypothetical protein
LAKGRSKLRRMISAYNTAVLTMLDEQEPETLDVVVAALRPMVRIREILSQRAGQSEDESEENLEEELLGDGADELAEADAKVTP